MIFLNLPLYIILKFIIFFSSFGTNKCLIYTTIPKIEKSYLKLNKTKNKKKKTTKNKVKQYEHTFHRKSEMFSTRSGKNKTMSTTEETQ